MNLLIVDDERTTFDILIETINWEKMGFVLNYASGTHEAFEKIKNTTPEIIITDIEMPEMDGLEFIEWIRSEDIQSEIIILSAYGKFEYAQQAITLGVSCYLLKPVREKELLKLLSSITTEIKKKQKAKKQIENFKKRQKENIFRKIIEAKGEFIPDYKKINQNPFQIVHIKLEETNYNFFVKQDIEKNSFLLEIESTILNFFCEQEVVIFKYSPQKWAFVVFHPDNNQKVEETFDLLNQLITKGKNIQAYFKNTDIITNLEDFYTEYDKLEKQSDLPHIFGKEIDKMAHHEVAVQRAIEYLRKEYDKDITLEQISNYCAVSKNYFCNIFKKTTGQSIWDYLTNIRIEFAKQYLNDTSLKNIEIAEKVGYDDPAYFTRIFKKKTGITPSEYRKTL